MKTWIPILALAFQPVVVSAAEHDRFMHMDGRPFTMIALDRFEYGDGNEGSNRLLDAYGWFGGDYNRLRVNLEGEGSAGESLETELQVLYDRTLSSFWSLQAGARHDFRPGERDTSYAVLGIQGLAPQWFETGLAVFVSENGDVSLRGEAEYDVLLTQRLVLQPHLEISASFSDLPELGIGSGFSASEAGLRLRYEIRRELAPYVGVRWERLHGETRDLARAFDEPLSSTSFVVGIKAWF